MDDMYTHAYARARQERAKCTAELISGAYLWVKMQFIRLFGRSA